MHKLVTLGILIPILTLIIPNAYALTLTEQYNSGFSEGRQQAITDFQKRFPFNSTCDSTDAYMTGGKHTSHYCAGWVKGYTATWNELVRRPGGFWAQQELGSGLCGGDFRRIRMQVQSNNGMQEFAFIDSRLDLKQARYIRKAD